VQLELAIWRAVRGAQQRGEARGSAQGVTHGCDRAIVGVGVCQEQLCDAADGAVGFFRSLEALGCLPKLVADGGSAERARNERGRG